MILGSRSSIVFCLDGASGQLIRKYEATRDTLSKLADQTSSTPLKGTLKEPLYIVRTDYSVQSLDENTGIVRWNLSMGHFGILTARGIVFPELPTTMASELPALPISPARTKLHLDSPPMLLPSTKENKLPVSHTAMEPLPPPAPHGVEQGVLLWIISQLLEIVAGNVAFATVTSLVLLGLLMWKSCAWFFLVKKPKSDPNVATGGKRKKHRKHTVGNDMVSNSTPFPKRPSMNVAAVPSSAGDSRPTDSGTLEPVSIKYRRKESVGLGDGLWVGRLFVRNTVIGYGSHGTIVLEGSLDGRTVAVKRLLVQFHEKALKEIAALIETDEHPNVVRCYAMEQDDDFVYVALERCSWSLNDLVSVSSVSNPVGATWTSSGGIPVPDKSDLWESGDKPSSLLLQLMRCVQVLQFWWLIIQMLCLLLEHTCSLEGLLR